MCALAQGEGSNSGWQPTGSCREGLLTALRCGETVLAAAAVRLILALIQNRVLDPDTLDSCGPRSHLNRIMLLLL